MIKMIELIELIELIDYSQFKNKIITFPSPAIGNSSAVLVATILPCIIHIILMKKQISTLNIIFDVILIIVSAIIMVICTVVSFRSMISSIM